MTKPIRARVNMLPAAVELHRRVTRVKERSEGLGCETMHNSLKKLPPIKWSVDSLIRPQATIPVEKILATLGISR